MNTKLRKHIDGKNDHREGYNMCVVYSYYCTMNDLEYKVSIIMCTQNDVGVEKREKSSQRWNQNPRTKSPPHTIH